MPKKFSDRDKKKWLELYESGKPDAQIAKEFSCNVRTVRRGIEEARSAMEAHVVREELLRRAVRNHQDSLLGLVEQALSAVVMPPANLDFRLDASGRIGPIQLEGGRVEVPKADASGLSIVLDAETRPEWELLQEHLKRDPMWSALNQWRGAIAAIVGARMALKQRATALLEKRTGYRIVSKIAHPPELYHDPLVPMAYQLTLNRAIGIPDGTNLESAIAVDAARGEVTHGPNGSMLARVPEAKALEKCAKDMKRALEELQASPEAARVGETHRAAQELIPKVRRAVGEIRLLGMIPGQCRICRRLGI